MGRPGTEPLMKRRTPTPPASILCAAAALLCVVVAPATANDGLIILASAHGATTTADRFVAAAEAKGLTVFSRIDHAAGAKAAGLDLAPTELIIFGTPKVGTALMQCDRAVGIDLPLKALIWQDADGKALLAYNDAAWMARRHDLGDCDALLGKVSGVLAGLAAEATAPDVDAD
jgi:uncharacterized protein (DUF302 family)